VKPARFEYARPASLDEALDLLAEHGDEAKVLAGGQSLVPLLNMRFARPGLLVDVNRVPGLDGIAEEDGRVRVGALVRQAAFGASPVVASRVPLAAECVPSIGHFVTRNRGTVGGSIAHADARAELPVVLSALGGSVVAASRRGRRTIPAEAFFVTHFTSSLEPDELVVETAWPAATAGAGFAFEEFAQRRGDFALGMAACALRVEEGRVAEARIVVGAAADRPLLVDEAAAELAGGGLGPDAARAAGAAAAAAVSPADSLHASASYQKHLTGLLVERAVARAWRDAGGEP
jgi:CO/xanthine dehydrogenase FAD-binding subunit